MIREASVADIPSIVDLVEMLVAAVNGPQRVCRVKTGETLCGLIQNPHGVVFISTKGFIAGCISSTIINHEAIALEMGWFAADRSGLRLLRAFEKWAGAKGATLIKMSCAGGAAQKVLERSGYRFAEAAWVR